MSNGDKNSQPARPGPKVFISYRRRFDTTSARLLKGKLTEAFGVGSVFRDRDDIPPGVPFRQFIREAIQSCNTLLVLISPGWIELVASLQDPDDFVRLEIASALAQKVRVIPVLLDGAQMPKEEDLPEDIRALTSFQAEELSDRHWDEDLRHLIEAVRKPFLQPPQQPSFSDKLSAAARFLFGTRRGLAVLAGLLVLVSLAVILSRSPGGGHDAHIGGLAFDPVDGCGDDKQECFWSVPQVGSGVVRTGTIKGVNLRGRSVVIAETGELDIADVNTISEGSNNDALRFSFKLRKSVPAGAGLNFKVVRPPTPGVVSSDNQTWTYLVSYQLGPATPAPTPARAALEECFRQFLPKDQDRWVSMEYGDPQPRIVARQQTEDGLAGILFTEDGRRIGAIRFRFVRSGQGAGGAVSGFFKIDKVVGADCRPVEDYSNTSGADKNRLGDYDYLDMLLNGRHYTLRLGYREQEGSIEAYFGKRPD
jgi:hypothetical protein